MELPGGGHTLSKAQVLPRLTWKQILIQEKHLYPFDLQLSDSIIALFFLFIGVLTRTFRIQFPSQVVFDETHFGNFTNYYLTGRYFYDIHPPLAKMIIAGFAKMSGYKGDYNFTMGAEYPTYEYISLRLIPALFSACVVPLSYLTLRGMLCSRMTSFVGAILVACDLAMIVEGRFILTDGILHFFAILAIFAIFIDDRYHTVASLVLEGACIGLVMVCKYTAGGILLFAIYREIIQARTKTRFQHTKLISAFYRSLIIVACVITVHIIVFWIHIRILPFKPEDPNELSPQFILDDLLDPVNPDWRKRNSGKPTIFKIAALLVYMQAGNLGVGYSHPYASSMLSWPLFLRKWVLFYASDNSIIACMGNVLTWWPVFTGVVVLIVILKRKGVVFGPSYYSQLLVGYMASYIPFLLIPRDLFLYHYTIPFIFGVCLLMAIIEKMLPRKVKGFVLAMLATAAIFGFVFWSPFAYGIPLEDHDFRIWNSKWR